MKIIWLFIIGIGSSIIAQKIGFHAQQWQYWAVSLPIIIINAIAMTLFNNLKE